MELRVDLRSHVVGNMHVMDFACLAIYTTGYPHAVTECFVPHIDVVIPHGTGGIVNTLAEHRVRTPTPELVIRISLIDHPAAFLLRHVQPTRTNRFIQRMDAQAWLVILLLL